MEDKIKEIIALVLGVNLSMITEKSFNSDFKQWDSLKHINIVMVLDDEFKVNFSIEEISELTSV
jgi:acyl carrier protein